MGSSYENDRLKVYLQDGSFFLFSATKHKMGSIKCSDMKPEYFHLFREASRLQLGFMCVYPHLLVQGRESFHLVHVFPPKYVCYIDPSGHMATISFCESFTVSHS